MNKLSGAEAFVRMLQLHGVKYLFGLCGDTSLPLYDALYGLDHGMTHILTRDERSAAYMADAYARVSGKVGVCEGPSGGGATYILPGIVEANESSIPVLCVTTDISVASRGRYTLTELDQGALFRPLTKWNRVIDKAEDIPKLMREAFIHMTTDRPGSVHIGLPLDVQKDWVDESEVWADPAMGSYPSSRGRPDATAVATAADAILSAKNPIFICGGGVISSGAEDELRILAEFLQAPVATTISGKGSIADNHPLAVGVVGSNGGTSATRGIVERADMVIFVGCRAGSVTTERWRTPAPGKLRVVHIDADPTVIGVNYPTEVGVVGDARLCLAALHEEVIRRSPVLPTRTLGVADVARAKEEKFFAFRALAQSDERPIRPERIVAELQAVLPRHAVIIADPGTPCPYLSAYYEFFEAGRHFISNRAHGALGYSLPAAVGAFYGRPGAKCVAVMGDGSFGFSCGEMETIVRLNIPVTLIVISNSSFGWIKAGQKHSFSQNYYSVDFSRTDHSKVAEAFELKAWRVSDPADLRAALSAAVARDGPTLVDIVAQPLEEAKAPVSEWIA
ncbi:MAG: thiamine pyrophosphate-binding protein [Candidatus Binatia bacterium]